ncbi:transporter [Adhaeribacter radiodurans]|uniref:Transporter n=1 Tax=Adhaeribacter radiodurans TaxID=2745197 RepID=A0A7L7LEK6_9BACT|nr:transporter [Adhaeribacter radiodurans]QMU31278.1 transporter [Adhaeribacter radiodurans]
MKYTLLLIFLPLVLPSITLAQTTSEPQELESDRPTFSQGATIVPHKTIQIETGLEYRKDETKEEQEKDFIYPTTLIRVGILKKVELRFNVDFEQQKHQYIEGNTAPGQPGKLKGLDNVRVGTKIALVEGEGAMPYISVLGNVTLPVGSKNLRPPHAAPEVRLLFKNELTEKLNLQYNVGYRKHKDQEEYRGEMIYSVNANFKLNDNLQTFAEYEATKAVNQPVDSSINGGFMYKVLPNLQLDVFSGTSVSEAAPDFYIGGGITWRIPR